MSPAIPRSVLSEHFQDRMEGQRLISAVFLTFELDPGFFELNVLPVFLDRAFSHAATIRRAQLEQALRELPGQIAVYYDANGLRTSDYGSAKLDVRRIPVRHKHGIFHPKNVILLVESDPSDASGESERSLIVGCSSANLTETGWWQNVEVCHVEVLHQNDRSVWAGQLEKFLRTTIKRASPDADHTAALQILDFLRRTDALQTRSVGGALRPHLFTKQSSLPDFLEDVAGTALRGMYLEVISPFLDDADDSAPLRELIERFEPKEARVYLPRTPAQEARCREVLYQAVKALPNTRWGRLPNELLSGGRADGARARGVHAKVYRFFSQSPMREILFVGSANLTRAAHQSDGNVESGFLVEVETPRRPEFWLEPEPRKPTVFLPQTEDDRPAASGGSRLNVRYAWDDNAASVFWDADAPAPALRLTGRGLQVALPEAIAPRTWLKLSDEAASTMRTILEEKSVLEVHGEVQEGPTLLLVDEVGMHSKPSVVLDLSAEEILEYWSKLTAEQRDAYIEAHAADSAFAGLGSDLIARQRRTAPSEGIFGQFAAIFLAFGQMERSVRKALAEDREREAVYLLFGNKPDSLGTLLARIQTNTEGDAVNRYVMMLCAEQVCTELRRDFAEFWREHRAEVKELERRLGGVEEIRDRLLAHDAEMPAFLEWFDAWFRRRVRPREAAA